VRKSRTVGKAARQDRAIAGDNNCANSRIWIGISDSGRSGTIGLAHELGISAGGHCDDSRAVASAVMFANASRNITLSSSSMCATPRMALSLPSAPNSGSSSMIVLT
jgi:hypothetical protein